MASVVGLVKGLLALFAVASLWLLASACDSFIEYTVDNATNEELEAWVFYQDCSKEVGYKSDYEYRRVVPPGEVIHVSDVTGALPSEPWCLQIVDSERRLVKAQPFPDDSYGVIVAVNEPIERGRIIPPQDELATRPWLDARWKELRDAPIISLFWIVGLTIIIATPYGIYRAIQDARSRREKRAQ